MPWRGERLYSTNNTRHGRRRSLLGDIAAVALLLLLGMVAVGLISLTLPRSSPDVRVESRSATVPEGSRFVLATWGLKNVWVIYREGDSVVAKDYMPLWVEQRTQLCGAACTTDLYLGIRFYHLSITENADRSLTVRWPVADLSSR